MESVDQSTLLRVAQLRQMLVSGRAKEIRTRAHLSAQEIARDVKVSPSQVCAWERGERFPRSAITALHYLDLLEKLDGIDSLPAAQ